MVTGDIFFNIMAAWFGLMGVIAFVAFVASGAQKIGNLVKRVDNALPQLDAAGAKYKEPEPKKVTPNG